MQNDLSDGVRWAVTQGISDESGWQFTAPVTSVMRRWPVAMTPALYVCGINYVGVAAYALLWIAALDAKAAAKAEVVVESRKQKIANAGLAARDDDETICTCIVGDFRGWTRRTVFTLENGQVWQQTDKEDRFFPKQVNPAVELIPSKLVV